MRNKKNRVIKDKYEKKLNIIIFILVGLIIVVTIVIGVILAVKRDDDSTGDSRSSNKHETQTDDSDTTTSEEIIIEENTYEDSAYKDEFIEYMKENDIETDAGKYYGEISTIVSVTHVEEADNILSESEVTEMLDSLGIDEYEIEYNYSIDGEYRYDMEAARDSADKHPMYQTYYETEKGDLWSVLVVGDRIIANPAYYNYESDLGVQVIFSEQDTVLSYDYISNSYYETIPKETALKVLKTDKIDAQFMEKMTKEEIDKLVK